VSSLIQQELQATGVAPVIVVLAGKPTAAAAAVQAKGLSRFFASSELSQESAILSEATARAAALPAVRPTRGRRREVERTLAAASAFRHRPVVRESPVPEVEPVPLVRYYPNLGVALGTVTRSGLAALRKDDQVAEVVGAPRMSLIRPTRRSPAALRARVTWGMQRLGVPALWEQGLRGNGVLVGHLDTGVDGTHPALGAAIEAFAEFDLVGRQIVPAASARDSGQHGTHTAGTIAGRLQGGRSVGIAPGCSLASAIVLEGGQLVARVLGGVDWAVGQGVRILNMSLGLRGWTNDFLPVIRRVRDRGILPVVSVGNEGAGTSRSPGNYAEALSIGGMDGADGMYFDSSSQRFERPADPIVPDLVAPGVDVISARPGGGYQSMDGTSMATAHVSGLAALLLEAKPEATVDEIEGAILGSARLEPGWAPDRAGRGIPAAERALELLSGAPD
jgi:subtilisin